MENVPSALKRKNGRCCADRDGSLHPGIVQYAHASAMLDIPEACYCTSSCPVGELENLGQSYITAVLPNLLGFKRI
jgi:hypothetical protein